MNHFVESLAQLFGRAPRKPQREEIRPAAQEIHLYKRSHKPDLEEMNRLHAEHHVG